MVLAEKLVSAPLLTKSDSVPTADRLIERNLLAGTITFNYPNLSGTDKGIMLRATKILSELPITNPGVRIIFVDQPPDETSIPKEHKYLNTQIDWIFKDDGGLSNNMYQRVIARAFTDYLTHGDLEDNIYEQFGPLLRAKIFSLLAIATKRDFPDKVLDNSIRCALQAAEYLKQAGHEEAAASFERKLKVEYYKANLWKELTPFSKAKPVESKGNHKQNGSFMFPWTRHPNPQVEAA